MKIMIKMRGLAWSVELLVRTSSILLYSGPALLVFLLTAILSLYVTIKVRQLVLWWSRGDI